MIIKLSKKEILHKKYTSSRKKEMIILNWQLMIRFYPLMATVAYMLPPVSTIIFPSHFSMGIRGLMLIEAKLFNNTVQLRNAPGLSKERCLSFQTQILKLNKILLFFYKCILSYNRLLPDDDPFRNVSHSSLILYSHFSF